MSAQRIRFELLEKHTHYKYRNVSDLTLSCVLKLDSRLDVARADRALRLVADAFPVLGCRVEKGFWNPSWVRRDNLDALTWCDLVETADPDAELQRYLAVPSRPWEGEQTVSGRILRGPEGDWLCLKVNHAASDAEGLRPCVYAAADFYSRLSSEPDFRPEPVVYDRGIGQILGAVPLWGKLAVFKQYRRDRLAKWYPPDAASLPVVTSGRDDRRFSTHVIAPERFARLKAHAKARHATVNDLMSALIGVAIMRCAAPEGEQKPRALRFVSPMDLRRYHPQRAGTEGPRNLSTMVRFSIPAQAPDDFDGVLTAFHDEFKTAVDGYGGLVPYSRMALRNLISAEKLTRDTDRGFKLLDDYVRSGKTVNLSLMISNAGILDATQLRFDGVAPREATLFGFTLFDTFYFVFSTFCGAVSTCVGYCDAARSKPVIDKVFQAMDAQIDRVCSQGTG